MQDNELQLQKTKCNKTMQTRYLSHEPTGSARGAREAGSEHHGERKTQETEREEDMRTRLAAA